jgi:glycosyltransferase involved in cell wall biosynthesis
LFYGHDIHFQRFAKEFAITGDREIEKEMTRSETIERTIWTQCDAIYYPSEDECNFVRAEFPGKNVSVMPAFILESGRFKAARERLKTSGIPETGQLLFIGGFRHRPNVDAMLWFVQEVWPRIAASAPCKLCIAGSFPPPEIMALANSRITVAGFISDDALTKLYESTQIAIVPLRFGAGVKGKVIEALSFGTPVVATSIGAEGLAQMRDVLDIGDTPGEFASAVLEILRNPAARVQKALAGVKFAETVASEAAARSAFGVDIPELARGLVSLQDKPEV